MFHVCHVIRNTLEHDIHNGYNLIHALKLLYSHNSQMKGNKTGVINDPLGQTLCLASSEHCFSLCLVLLDFEKWWRMNMCENNEPYRPWLWVGRVDQLYEVQLLHVWPLYMLNR